MNAKSTKNGQFHEYLNNTATKTFELCETLSKKINSCEGNFTLEIAHSKRIKLKKKIDGKLILDLSKKEDTRIKRETKLTKISGSPRKFCKTNNPNSEMLHETPKKLAIQLKTSNCKVDFAQSVHFTSQG